MPVNIDNYNRIIRELGDKVTLVAVSKTKYRNWEKSILFFRRISAGTISVICKAIK
jgi:hypothetical protein